MKNGQTAYLSQRTTDPYLNRRQGADRRKVYSLIYFYQGNLDRRINIERRSPDERRSNGYRINTWASICPNHAEEVDIIFIRK